MVKGPFEHTESNYTIYLTTALLDVEAQGKKHLFRIFLAL